MDEQRVISRINGRNMAGEIVKARLLNDADFADRDYMEAFVEELKRVSGHWVETPELVKHQPIARLGSHVLDYGEFRGRCLDDIPLERIDWYLRKAEENAKILGAYMTHPELESRRSAEIGEPI